MVELFFGR